MVKQTKRNNSNYLWKVLLICLVVIQLSLAYWLGKGGLASESFPVWLTILIISLPIAIATFIAYILAFRFKLGRIFFPKLNKYPGIVTIFFTTIILIISFAAFFNSIL